MEPIIGGGAPKFGDIFKQLLSKDLISIIALLIILIILHYVQ